MLGRIPAGVPIMATAINDQATTGILRAVKQAGREADLIVVGMGADELQTMIGRARPSSLRSAISPSATATTSCRSRCRQLAGKTLPPAVLVNHVMVTKGNVCQYYPGRSNARR